MINIYTPDVGRGVMTSFERCYGDILRVTEENETMDHGGLDIVVMTS